MIARAQHSSIFFWSFLLSYLDYMKSTLSLKSNNIEKGDRMRASAWERFSHYVLKGRVASISIVAGLSLLAGMAFPYSSFAETLYSQTDSSYISSTASNWTNPRVVLNNNNPLGITGTLYSYTFYTDSPTDWDSWLQNGSHTETNLSFYLCNSSFDSSAGLGCYADSRTPNDYLIQGNYVTIIFDSPMNITSGQYAAVNLYGGPTIPYYGSDPSSCYVVNSNSGVYGSGQCTGSGSLGIGNIWISVNGSGGFVPPVTDTTTRFLSIDPAYASTTATSSISFGGSAYINEDDYREGMYVYAKLENPTILQGGLIGTLAFPATGLNVFSIFVGNDTGEWYFPISEFGDFDFSTTTAVNYIGQYNATYEIRYADETSDYVLDFLYTSLGGLFNPLGVFTPDLKTLAATTSYFIAVERNTINNISETIGIANDNFVNNAASSTEELLEACSVWSSGSSILGCLTVMFIPSTAGIKDVLDNAQNGFLSRFPLGYVSRTISIMATTSTSTLPIVSYTFPSDYPIPFFAGDTYSFNPWPYFYVEGSVLNDQLVSTGDNPQNSWEIVEDIFVFMVYFALIMAVLSDLFDIELYGMWSASESESVQIATSGKRKGQVIARYQSKQRGRDLRRNKI